jgi:hypothetical protein
MVEATPFEIVASKLVELGFYNFFFPFLIVSVIMFALLRKSKVLGDSSVINGLVALSIGLLVMGFPVLTGLTFATELSTFFTQVSVWILILVLGAVIASVFYPDLTKVLSEQFKHRSFLFIMLAVAIAIFVTSGMVSVFTNLANPAITGEEPELPGPPADIVIVVAALIIFMILIIIAAVIMRRGAGGA